ncbi:eukaryotic translation initiation factor 3 subunit G-1-like [Planococcus citri]|uniref:eukaryotic translation initiation factor 3 subunit G-1-like n=1 Tax=Planococcus citri TaxID=170843 RepID=UPI0031FA31E6
MPSVEPISSWADEAEAEIEGKKHLPPSSEIIQNDHKIITEYRYNEDDKLEKVVRTFKIERRVVSKSVAARKLWKKYGESSNDKPGPNPSNTFVGEEVQMQFITCKEDADKPDENPLEKLKEQKGLVKCRTCNGDHWTLSCPYKDMMKLKPDEKLPPPSGGGASEDRSKSVNKYVPPSLREGANARRGDSLNSKGYDALAIRISNLSPNTSDHDLEELVKPFGAISKLYLAKEKSTGLCRGFAYIHFKSKTDAHVAINKLNGYGYDHLILKVDWSKPTNN